MLYITCASLKEHWREACIFLAVEFKYQQAFSSIVDSTFNFQLVFIIRYLRPHTCLLSGGLVSVSMYLMKLA